MKYLKSTLFAIAAVFVFASCSEDKSEDYCYNVINTGFDSVTGPETTTVDEPVVINATFGISNGCGTFVRFVESNGFPKNIYARVDYVGCVCTEMYQTVTKPYTFQASAAGEYELRFMKPAGGFISKTITVTE